MFKIYLERIGKLSGQGKIDWKSKKEAKIVICLMLFTQTLIVNYGQTHSKFKYSNGVAMWSILCPNLQQLKKGTDSSNENSTLTNKPY